MSPSFIHPSVTLDVKNHSTALCKGLIDTSRFIFNGGPLDKIHHKSPTFEAIEKGYGASAA